MGYMKAKYYSFKTGLELYCTRQEILKPFKLYHAEKLISDISMSKWKQRIKVTQAGQINFREPETAFITDFKYTHIPGYANLEHPQENDMENILLYALDNQQFGDLARGAVQPVEVTLPHKSVKKFPVIGIHYRAGSGGDPSLASPQLYENVCDYKYYFYDHPLVDLQKNKFSSGTNSTSRDQSLKRKKSADENWPTKFPPLQYYLDQLLLLCKHLNSKATIILCTDHQHPESIASIISKFLTRCGVHYKSVVVANRDIMTDLVTLANCDILIRGNSAYARTTQLMGKHTVIVRPHRTCWRDKKLFVSEVAIDVRSANFISKFPELEKLKNQTSV